MTDRVAATNAFLARRLVPVVLAVYLVTRFISAAVILWIADHQDPRGLSGLSAGDRVGYVDMTHIWDGEWYRRIATEGYPTSVPRDESGHARQSALAFYPLFPLLARLVMALTGLGFAVVASTIALALGFVAVVLMAKLLSRHVSPLVTVCVVLVYATSPPSPSLQMAYTESMAMALLCGVLLALDREEWSLAGALAVGLGLARPMGVPLALVAAVVVGRRWWQRGRRPIKRSEYADLAVCLVGCGMSGLLWPALAAVITGERQAYSETMGAWRATHEVVPFEAWGRISGFLFGQPSGMILVVLLVVAMVALIVGPWSQRLGLVMRVWCAAYALYLFAFLEPWTSTYRYLLGLFPLAAALIGGGWPRERRRWVVPAVTTAVVVVNLLGQLYWAWHYLRFVPPSGNPI